MQANLLIDGQSVETSHYAELRDPGRFNHVIGTVAQADKAHVDAAVRAAATAFAGWSATPYAERAALLLQVADLLDAMNDELTPVVVGETGMLPAEIKAEIAGAAFAVRDNVDAATRFLEPKQWEDSASWVSVEKRAIGVIAAFAPWNAPIVLMMRKVAPALACGNTIVVKTPPTAPLGQSMVLSRIAGLFPPGVINVVHGGNDTGAALVRHAGVRKVSFTGGGKAATAIMCAAADTIKGVQFELGGNDPAIVLDDADFDAIMPNLVAGAFHRSGQFCFAIKRIYVPQDRLDAFFDRMADELGRVRIGHQSDARTNFGPVNNRAQYEYVQTLRDASRAAGATVVELGEEVDPEHWADGYYLRPTLVKGLDPKADLVTCEQFGPILPILGYCDEDDVLEMANDTEYGLGSSVWSSSFDRAVSFARNIESGMTFINKNAQSRLGRRHMPFGGVKQSGIGTENSELGLAEYIEYHGINFHK
jgi:acyl-CoA reductase-like NAD-dependent aldehyde dehydrogenase